MSSSNFRHPVLCLRRVRQGVPACLGLLLAVQAQAQPMPDLGLWESKFQMLVNGKDLMADMRRQQAEMLKQLPPAQRAQMEAMMKAQGGALDEVRRDCVTAEDRKAWSDPAARLREMEKDAPQCRFEPVEVSGAVLKFKGRCTDPQGYTGDMAGTFTLEGPRAWRSSMSGKGRVQGLPQTVEYRMEGTGRWVGAQCPAPKPATRP